MKFFSASVSLFAAVALRDSPLVSAHPKGELVIACAVNCKAATGVLGAVKALGAPATSFCSSLLQVPATSTVQTTITPPPTQVTETAQPVLVTVSVISAICPQQAPLKIIITKY
ncbi:hypothetical protein C7974DRAFT_379198 [Boeremia exigua]|uniref:uncharacterized protein n=1 Tax=Boeremia exigua TaxID=749465 RepID=UPI001E8D7545|nr:uncharacterized protein C7974DRAFT_379198 [Boeremia exigua]KAH6616258.1 hypothetical protein C7974DRAFT_379198 [Boeremia exigua]